jgi:hypothetical protein
MLGSWRLGGVRHRLLRAEAPLCGRRHQGRTSLKRRPVAAALRDGPCRMAAAALRDDRAPVAAFDDARSWNSYSSGRRSRLKVAVDVWSPRAQPADEVPAGRTAPRTETRARVFRFPVVVCTRTDYAAPKHPLASIHLNRLKLPAVNRRCESLHPRPSCCFATLALSF